MMNEDFKMAREKYEQNVASQDFRNDIEKLFEKSKKKKGILWGISSFAAVLVGFVIVLNTNEAFANSLSNVDGLEKIVQILTGGKYKVNTPYYSASVLTPKVTGLSDKEFEAYLNQELKENAQIVINDFEKDMERMEEEEIDGHLGVSYGYEVITDNEDLLVLDVYAVNTVGSSSTQHKFYNIAKKENCLITLKEWVKDPEYIEKTNQYILKEMEKREQEEGISYFWKNELGFKTITEDTQFYIKENRNVVISFEKYEIAPGAYGNIEFEIPLEIFSVQSEKI